MNKSLFILATAFTININAQIITTVAGGGSCGGNYCGDGGQATAAELSYPFGTTFDASGNMYIADQYNNRIRMVTTSGIINTVAGSSTQGYSGDGGAATAAKLASPHSIASDAAGNLYIADYNNHCIRMVNTVGVISTIAGTGIHGYSGDGAAATTAQLYYPSGVAVDISGNLYIVDTQNNRVRKVNTAGIISTVAGNGTQSYSGDFGQATTAELDLPGGIAFDAAGNYYIADYNNARIRKVNTLGIITTVAGSGGFNYSGDGGQATNAGLNFPTGVTLDASGNIYIADQYNNRIRKVNTTGIISTIAGNGTASYSGDGAQATSANLNYPTGVACDATGNLYIADFNNNRIRMVSASGTTSINELKIENEELNIYPNPNNGSFVIELNNSTKHTMQLYDVNGKLVLSQTINGKITIDASGIDDGVYNISIINNEAVVNKRLVIVR